MRILWIAGLGAVLVTGGVHAQGMNATPGGTGSTNERALDMQPAEGPGQTLRAQDPRLSQQPMRGEQNMRQPGPVPGALQRSSNDPSPDQARQAQDPRLSQDRMQTRQETGRTGPVPEALQRSPNDASPDQVRQAQDPRLPSQRATQRGHTGEGMRGERATGTGAMGRTDAPRNPEDRAYMGGGMILENGRPVPLPGDPPGLGSDFRGGQVGQSGSDQGMGGSPSGDRNSIGN